MHAFKLLPQFILRTPYYTYLEVNENTIDEIIADPVFKAALYMASDSLYQELLAHHFKTEKLSPKIIHSLKKYANRMANRTTPFGAFSSFSFIEKSKSAFNLTVSNQSFKLHLSPDFSLIIKAYEIFNKTNHATIPLLTNQTIYYTARDIRYLSFDNTDKYNRKFTLRKIERDKAIISILNYCNKVRSPHDLLTFMSNHFDLNVEESAVLLEQLRSIHLLLPATTPCINGTNQFTKNLPLINTEKTVSLTNQPLYIFNKTIDQKQFINLPAEQDDHNLTDKTPGTFYYSNLEREAQGYIPETASNNLTDAMNALKLLAGTSILKALTDFKMAFKDKFDLQAVPLLFALDPETGISYGDLTHSETEDSLIADINFGNKSTKTDRIKWELTQSILMRKWPKNGIGTVELDTEDLEEAKSQQMRMPPSFSIVFKVIGQQVLIEQAGGNSAAALMGRFTSMSKEVHEHCLSITAHEQKTNDQVIFAELNFISDAHVDNISRREPLRTYEIPILTGSALPPNQQIKLSDLMINVDGNEILLWSKKLKKRIIPKLSSAFNFQRSELAVFRFLADLQNQNIQANWGIDLMQLFPGLKCYPRLMYKNAILFLATWKLDKKSISKIITTRGEARYHNFLELAKTIGLTRNFTLTAGDKFLAFDLDSQESIEFLLAEIAGQNEFTLRELLKESPTYGTVTNEHGDTFANEFIATVLNLDEVYPKQYKKPQLNSSAVNKHKVPRECEWLYFKVYCPTFNSNEVLYLIDSLLAKNTGKKKMHQWFFVRYNDPAPHLRIRINGDSLFLQQLYQRLQKLFGILMQQNKIEGTQVETYIREIERYGELAMETVEHVFYRSSIMAIKFLKQQQSIKSFNLDYKIAVTVAYDLICLYLAVDSQRLHFIRQVKEMLFEEFGGSTALKVDLDRKKRAMRNGIADILGSRDFYINNNLSADANRLFNVTEILKKKQQQNPEKLLADIVHMHINRVFSKNMREQELVVYTLMHQFELTKQKTRLSFL